MADQGWVYITARKEVENRDQAREIYDLVKAKLIQRPDIIISGQYSNHFDFEEEIT